MRARAVQGCVPRGKDDPSANKQRCTRLYRTFAVGRRPSNRFRANRSIALVGAVGLPRPLRERSFPRAEAPGRIPENRPQDGFLDGIPPHRFESPRAGVFPSPVPAWTGQVALVGAVGLEPTRPKSEDFKSPAYAISPRSRMHGHALGAQVFMIAKAVFARAKP